MSGRLPAGDYGLSGKYRLTFGQEAVLLAVADHPTGELGALARSPHTRGLEGRGDRMWGSTNDVRAAAQRLLDLGLIERFNISEHRYGHRLTDEGRIDVAARRGTAPHPRIA